jgi:hypothetical protein
MKITIYYNSGYYNVPIPFGIYMHSLYYILKRHLFEVNMINDIHQLETDVDVVILFMNELDSVLHITDKKIVLIHADYIKNHCAEFQAKILDYITVIHPKNIYIWEYSVKNLDYYKENKIDNVKCSFIPLLYDEYLEYMYNELITNKIDYDNKPIEILFMGNMSNRRSPMLQSIAERFKLYIMTDVNDISSYINVIENSKLVIHLYSNDNNTIFDYYRSALLYSNKILYLNEECEVMDRDIEHNIVDLNNVILKCDYNSMIEKIEEILKKPQEELNEIIEKSYIEFKKHNMKDRILQFFSEC